LFDTKILTQRYDLNSLQYMNMIFTTVQRRCLSV